ncbi:MAG TPA: cupin domain-containing protein [Euzebyales bacterium]|nr:cupin domain-containing protein [Euzebyales bacterium]
MPVIPSAALSFTQLPGRESADALRDGPDVGASVRVVRIAPGPRTPHRHPHSGEVVSVVAGTGIAWEDGQRTAVTAGDLIAIPRGVPHATVAGEHGLVLVCFFPHPDLAGNIEELDAPRIAG